jgi:hypothetical protein
MKCPRPLTTNSCTIHSRIPAARTNGVISVRQLVIFVVVVAVERATEVLRSVSVEQSVDDELPQLEMLLQSERVAISLQQQLIDLHKQMCRQRDILKNLTERTTERETFLADG